MRQAIDPDGRIVVLTTRAWTHIVERHGELEPYLDDIVKAIENPSRRLAGRAANEEWFLLTDAGPSRWLQVVVHFEGGQGSVTTAFARRWMS
jgi:hypothetical protein